MKVIVFVHKKSYKVKMSAIVIYLGNFWKDFHQKFVLKYNVNYLSVII